MNSGEKRHSRPNCTFGQNCTSSETSKIPFRSLTRQTDAMRRVVQHVHCIELAGYSDCNTTTGAAAASSSSATRILTHAHTAAHSPRRRRTTNRTEGGREGRPSAVRRASRRPWLPAVRAGREQRRERYATTAQQAPLSHPSPSSLPASLPSLTHTRGLRTSSR